MNLNLYSVDLSIWEGSQYLISEGKELEQVTRDDWSRMIKGLYDWICDLQRAEGKRRPKDERLQDLMYAYGRRRPLKFALLTVISKSHKRHLNRKLKPTVYHAHMLVYGYRVSVVVGLIKYYWTHVKGYAKSEPSVYDIKCYNDGKLIYNLAQQEGKPKVCISPAVTVDDLQAMYYGEFASLERFAITGRIETAALIKSIQLYGQILIRNGYSTSVKGRWMAGIRTRKSLKNKAG